LLLLATETLQAQELLNPFSFPILLSGNFGELRNDHFHAGLDFKTQGVEGKSVRAVEDGYVARIVVSPWGYGNALYLNHPGGITSVYGHLQQFADRIAAYVKEQQYAQESFSIDLNLLPEQFTVRKGQSIALAGNSGSSAGPHLHLEIRNTETGLLYDPLEYYKEQIKDNRPPKIEGFLIYPIEGQGVVNGKQQKKEIKLPVAGNGRQMPNEPIEAWGEIALAVKAYDQMNGTSNIYGVRRLAMAVDSQVVFSSNIDRFPPEESRYINSFIDYEAWKERRSFYMKTFTEPGNRLSFINSVSRGIIRIDEERIYRITFRLRDIYGNLAQYTLPVKGKKQLIPAPDTEGEYFHWKSENRFGSKGIRLLIPAGSLYDDIYFGYAIQEKPEGRAPTHTLHKPSVALHKEAQLSLRLQKGMLDGKHKQKYGIVRMQNKRAFWVGGDYRNGWIEAGIRSFGDYTIMQDTTPPVITAVNPSAWISSQRITFRISDNLSGIQTFRGEIDGLFALFEFDGKKNLVTYRFDKTRLTRGKHKLTFTLVDACGNQAKYNHSFMW
jgi:hypothetical protein